MKSPDTILIDEGTAEQFEACITKAIGEGYKAIFSEIGVMLVKDPKVAMLAFSAMLQVYVRTRAENTSVISCDTRCGAAVAFGAGTYGATFLYGVPDEDVMKFLHSTDLSIERPD